MELLLQKNKHDFYFGSQVIKQLFMIDSVSEPFWIHSTLKFFSNTWNKFPSP